MVLVSSLSRLGVGGPWLSCARSVVTSLGRALWFLSCVSSDEQVGDRGTMRSPPRPTVVSEGMEPLAGWEAMGVRYVAEA